MMHDDFWIFSKEHLFYNGPVAISSVPTLVSFHFEVCSPYKA